jgi:hypothetical protein
MIFDPKTLENISAHPFMKTGGTDFMKLWQIKDIDTIYEIVFTNIAIKEKVHWKTIYVFSSSSIYYSQLCVAILVIYDALKYLVSDLSLRRIFMQPKELEIINSYFLTQPHWL